MMTVIIPLRLKAQTIRGTNAVLYSNAGRLDPSLTLGVGVMDQGIFYMGGPFISSSMSAMIGVRY